MKIDLKTLREAAGLTQQELASKAKVAIGTVYTNEQNGGLPTLLSLVKLTRALSQELKRPFWDVFQELVVIDGVEELQNA